jgi:hypothetical protein
LTFDPGEDDAFGVCALTFVPEFGLFVIQPDLICATPEVSSSILDTYYFDLALAWDIHMHPEPFNWNMGYIDSKINSSYAQEPRIMLKNLPDHRSHLWRRHSR